MKTRLGKNTKYPSNQVTSLLYPALKGPSYEVFIVLYTRYISEYSFATGFSGTLWSHVWVFISLLPVSHGSTNSLFQLFRLLLYGEEICNWYFCICFLVLCFCFVILWHYIINVVSWHVFCCYIYILRRLAYQKLTRVHLGVVFICIALLTSLQCQDFGFSANSCCH